MFLPTPQFLNKISKRLRFTLAALFLTLFLIFASFLQGRAGVWGVLFFSLLSVLGVSYLLGYRVYLVFPFFLSLSTGFVQCLFPHTLLWFKIAFWFFYFGVFYLLLLSLNIFAVSERRQEIPLLRPAKTALFLVVVLIAFYGFSAILKGVFFFPFQIILVAAFSFILSFTLFTLFRGGRPGAREASFLIAWACLGAFLALSFLPLKSFLRGLVLSATFYTALSLGREYFAHRLDRRLVLEYFALILALGGTVFWLGAK